MHNMPSKRRLLQALAAASALLAAPASALAAGGGIFFDAFTSFGRVDDASLHVIPMTTEPDPLKERNLRLYGGGNFYGGGMHGVIYGKDVRGGLGLGVFGADGIELRHDALPQGISTSLARVWGVSIDVFVGRELLKGPVYPYVDLRATFDVLQAGVVMSHPDYGALGETLYNAYSFGVGPRLGVQIPLSEPWALNFSGYYGLFGAQQMTIVASIGGRDR